MKWRGLSEKTVPPSWAALGPYGRDARTYTIGQDARTHTIAVGGGAARKRNGRNKDTQPRAAVSHNLRSAKAA